MRAPITRDFRTILFFLFLAAFAGFTIYHCVQAAPIIANLFFDVED